MTRHYILPMILALFNVILIGLFLCYDPFFEWAYQRHENVWSWYIRPLLLIPFGLAAFKRSLSGVLLCLFLILSSMFWFPRPDVVPEEVQGFLEMEKSWIRSHWNWQKVLEAFLIPLGLASAVYALWRRSLKIGALIIGFFIVLKIIWSLIRGGEQGAAIILPAVVGAGVILILAFIAASKRRIN